MDVKFHRAKHPILALYTNEMFVKHRNSESTIDILCISQYIYERFLLYRCKRYDTNNAIQK
jgi:hypothetical protein